MLKRVMTADAREGGGERPFVRPLSLEGNLALRTAKIFGIRPPNKIESQEELDKLIRRGREWDAAPDIRFLSRFCDLFTTSLGAQGSGISPPLIMYTTLAGTGTVGWRTGVSAFDMHWQPRGEYCKSLYEQWFSWVEKRTGSDSLRQASEARRVRFCKFACAMFLAIRPFETYNSRIMMLIYFVLHKELGLPLTPIGFREARGFFQELSLVRARRIAPRFYRSGVLCNGD